MLQWLASQPELGHQVTTSDGLCVLGFSNNLYSCQHHISSAALIILVYKVCHSREGKDIL